MLIPQTVNLTGYRGATFNEQVNFWQDDAQTVAFDFSSWNVAINCVYGGDTFSPSFSIASGTLFIAMYPSETAARQAAGYHMVIALTAKTGSPAEVEYLANGTFTFKDA